MRVLYQCSYVENHVYANKSRRTYVHNICQLLNPAPLFSPFSKCLASK